MKLIILQLNVCCTWKLQTAKRLAICKVLLTILGNRSWEILSDTSNEMQDWLYDNHTLVLFCFLSSDVTSVSPQDDVGHKHETEENGEKIIYYWL